MPFLKRISPEWEKRHLKKFIKQKNPLARLESWALQTNAARSVCIVPSLDVVVVVVQKKQKIGCSLGPHA